jgi:methionyl-tRNA formyltransferase
MRIVFFGTPAFAASSLTALLEAGHRVTGVVSQPDRPQGRSRSNLVPPPVKLVAEEAGLPLLQPERPGGDVFLAALRRFDPDIGVVVAYGHLLRPEVLEVPRLGMINVHASLLPLLRGAAPIPWAIAQGERETGISIMQMEKGLDSGPVFLRVPTPIGPTETGGELTERLAGLGAHALIEVLNRIEGGGVVQAEPQQEEAATYAPKLSRDTARIDWAAPADEVARRIRAFDPVPGAWTTLGGNSVKLFGARTASGSGVPGAVLQTGEELLVAAGDERAVTISEVQPSGKRRMAAGDWLRGRGISVGQRLE